MMNRRTALVVGGVLGVLASPGSLAAQESFAAQFAAAEQLPLREVQPRRNAFRLAYTTFTGLEPGTPGYRRALPNAARSALFSGLPKEAASLFAELHREGPRTDVSLRLELSSLLRSGQEIAAVKMAKAQIAALPLGVYAWVRGQVDWLPRTSDFGRIAALGGTRLRRGDADGLWLLETQDRAMEGLPGRYFSRGNLGLAYRLLGRFRDAETAYQAAIREAPKEPWLHNDFGLLMKGQGRDEEAAAAYLRGLAVEPKPGSSNAGNNLAVLFLRTGKRRGREPLEDVQRVVLARPDSAMPRRLLLSLLASRKRR